MITPGLLVPMDQFRFLLLCRIEGLEVSWCQYYVSDPLSKNFLHMFNCRKGRILTRCAQHCSDERNFADSGEMSSGVVILGLVLVLILEMQDIRPQHLIQVRLAHQVSHYNHQIYCPQFFNISRGTWRTLLHENPCLILILKFCEKWHEDQSTLTMVLEAALGTTNPNKASIERKMDTV